MALGTVATTLSVIILAAAASTRPRIPRRLGAYVLAVVLLGGFEGLWIYLDANGILTP